MQKYMTETKAALEDTVKEHRESVKIARRIENDIKVSILTTIVWI